jgi:hypothetical protein
MLFKYARMKDGFLRELKRRRFMKPEEINSYFAGQNRKDVGIILFQLEYDKFIEGHFINGYDISKLGSVFIQTDSYVKKDLRKYGLWLLNLALVITGLVYTILTYYQTKPSKEKQRTESPKTESKQTESKDSLKSPILAPIKDTLPKSKSTSPSARKP